MLNNHKLPRNFQMAGNKQRKGAEKQILPRLKKYLKKLVQQQLMMKGKKP